MWEASQGLLLRDEALSNLGRQGRFDGSESRKTAQETILEIARNPLVVAAALATATTADDNAPAVPLSDKEIKQVSETVAIKAPKGGEFGHSEVIYLTVRRPTPRQAVAMTTALLDQIEQRLRTLRNAKASSLIGELQKAAEMAAAERDVASRRLQELETQVGSDLGELRTLTEGSSGESNLRNASNKIKEELRQAQARHAMSEQFCECLQQAQANPDGVLAMPTQLLDAQPALKRLKEGLVDAQLRTSQLLGRTSSEHPLAQAALAAEQKIRQNMRDEVQSALRSVEGECRLSAALVASLEGQLADVERRLDNLARVRVHYSTLVSETKQRNQTLDEAQKALSETRAIYEAATASSLITRMDRAQVGDSPVGPSQKVMTAAGAGLGLAIGLGLVLLVAPAQTARGRRFTDYLRNATATLYGRRVSDKVATVPVQTSSAGRRASDQLAVEDNRRAGDRRGGEGIPAVDRRA